MLWTITLEKLVKAGYKVAICEQVSVPDGKSLVDRRVIRIVTPGTYVPEEAGERGTSSLDKPLK